MSTNIWLELDAICRQKQRVLHPLLREIDTCRHRLAKYRSLRNLPVFLTLTLTILSLQVAYTLLRVIRDFLVLLRFVLLCLLIFVLLLGVGLWLGLSMHSLEAWGWSTFWVFAALGIVSLVGSIVLTGVGQLWVNFGYLYRYPLYRRWCHECAVWRGLRKKDLYRLRALDQELYRLSRDLTLEDICLAPKTAQYHLPIFQDQLCLSRMIYARRNLDLRKLEREWEGYLTFLFPKV